MEVLTNSIIVSSSDLKAIITINQAKNFSGHLHKRKLPMREEEHEEHKKCEYEAHFNISIMIYTMFFILNIMMIERKIRRQITHLDLIWRYKLITLTII